LQYCLLQHCEKDASQHRLEQCQQRCAGLPCQRLNATLIAGRYAMTTARRNEIDETDIIRLVW